MLRIGSRVPVNTEKGGMHCMDVGLKVDVMQVEEVDGRLTGMLSLEIEQRGSTRPGCAGAGHDLSHAGAHRLARHAEPLAGAPFALTPGKPATLGTIDDVNSNRRFQVEVTATKP